ncbi:MULTISPECIES: hypothetical protein [unclassified Streptomyces]|uniref:hypothetical protein n=1 Tax=unclassified Streptomyces TaxID=2593676 RepID=UPI003D8CBCC6
MYGDLEAPVRNGSREEPEWHSWRGGCGPRSAVVKALVDAEPGTLASFSFRVVLSSFWIFGAFETEEDREARDQGKVRQQIEARGGELFSAPPTITSVNVLAAKLPGGVAEKRTG